MFGGLGLALSARFLPGRRPLRRKRAQGMTLWQFRALLSSCVSSIVLRLSVRRGGLMVFASGLSDVGCKRSSNQDRISIDLQSSVFVVADGLGGEQCGELAAEIAVDAVTAY